MDIIPAINAVNFEEAKKQFEKIAATGAPMFHLDIVDGTFAPNVTWGSPEELQQLITNYQLPITNNFEIHLMVKNPELVVDGWLQAGAKRIIVHVEAMNDEEVITDQCKEHGAEAMLAAWPNTSIDDLLAYKKEFQMFQLLAVPPGRAGQKFDERILEKIRELREALPDATIEVDGGINLGTAKPAKAAGADILVSASYILKSVDPRKAYEELRIATE